MKFRGVLSFLAGEWPLFGAALGIASLSLLPYFKHPLPMEAGETGPLNLLSNLVDKGDHEAAERGLREFLAGSHTPVARGEAHYHLARSILARPGWGRFPGVEELDRAWGSLKVARSVNFRSADAHDLQRGILHALLERGYAREAEMLGRALWSDTGDPDLLLDVAQAVALEASQGLELDEGKAREAESLVEKYLETAEGPKRLMGLITRGLVASRHGRDEEALAVFDSALKEFPEDAAGIIHLERAKVLVRLGRTAPALEALAGARDGVDDVARLVKADLHFRAGDAAAGRDLCQKMIRSNSLSAAPARLILGRWELEGPGGSAVEMVGQGLSKIERPDVLERIGFEFAGFYEALRRARERGGEDPDSLARHAAAQREIQRLFPREGVPTQDLARLLRRLGDALVRRAWDREDARDSEGARRDREEANARYAGSAEESIAAAARLGDPAQALLEAADALYAGQYYLLAAAAYRKYHEFNPRLNTVGVFLQAKSLMEADILRSPDGRRPDALSVFDEYIQAVKPGDARLPEAILSRGRILSALGEKEAAVAEFDRVLEEAALGIGPQTEEWAVALLERGRALLAWVADGKSPGVRTAGLRGEGLHALKEYLDRYGQGDPPRTGLLEAGYRLAAAAVEDRDWKAALGHLRRVQAIPRPVRRSSQGTDEEFLMRSRFLEGEVLLQLAQYEEADRSFGRAYRAYVGRPERLWGLLGRARARARLGRRQEALDDLQDARMLYEEDRGDFDGSLAGHGREYWTYSLKSLEQELQ